jgi:metal-responsive CopG/Arc/MetJ family transcriptional regulator
MMKSKITVTIDEDVIKSVEALATEESRSISSLINKILKDFLKEQNK